MEISSSLINQISPPVQTENRPGDEMGKDEFLKLMVTQMQHQDPLNPEDPTEFTSQLTQFSSLEQLINLNSGLESLAAQQQLGMRVSAAEYVGRTVRVQGDVINLREGQATEAYYVLGRDSDLTSMEVYNENGQLVDVVNLGRQNAGEHSVRWDGMLGDEPAAAGDYTFAITTSDSRGEPVEVETSYNGNVGSVAFDQEGVWLEIDGRWHSLDSVISIEADAAPNHDQD